MIEKGFMVLFLFLFVIYAVQYAVTGTDQGSVLFQTLGPILVGLACTVGLALVAVRYAMSKKNDA